MAEKRRRFHVTPLWSYARIPLATVRLREHEDDERTRALGLNLEGVRYAPRLPDPGVGTGDELVVSHAEADCPSSTYMASSSRRWTSSGAPVPLLEEVSLEDAESTAGVLSAGSGSPSRSPTTNRCPAED
jgi:hypothetical protein